MNPEQLNALPDEQANRQREAAATEAAIVTHFGPEANNCARWPELYRLGWVNYLTNSSAAGGPKGLPTDAEGCIIGGYPDDEGCTAHADPPSIYSDKFTYYLALQLPHGAATARQQVSAWLHHGDEIDCDELRSRLDQLEDLLHQDELHYLACTGGACSAPVPVARQTEFLNRLPPLPKGAGVLLGRAGVAVPGAGQLRAKEARRVLKALRLALQAHKLATPDAPDTAPPAAPATTAPPQPGSPAPNKGGPHPGAPLDTAPAPLTERLPIDDVLAMPRPALDRILLDAAMIEPDTTPGRYKAKPTVKPWQWANVRAALQTKLLLAEINDEDAALLFTETYGAKVGRGTMQKRPQNEQNSKFKTRRVIAYAEFRDRLPASNPS